MEKITVEKIKEIIKNQREEYRNCAESAKANNRIDMAERFKIRQQVLDELLLDLE